jgi:hypothetical protein
MKVTDGANARSRRFVLFRTDPWTCLSLMLGVRRAGVTEALHAREVGTLAAAFIGDYLK